MPDKSPYVVQMEYQNPHATLGPLFMPVMVICNTPDDVLEKQITINSLRPLHWVGLCPEHNGIAVLAGGGPSLADNLPFIRSLEEAGATLFAMNGASGFLSEQGFLVDYQVIADAQAETVSLIDPKARGYLFASQVCPDAFDIIPEALLWHLHMEGMEKWFPGERLKKGGYTIIGGGAAVGNAALCLAFVLGYRTFHLFGYDSSHRGENSHAYPQAMNWKIPCVNVPWAGKVYRSSVAMKAQAEKFQITGQQIKRMGADIHVHGDGLLPAMWNTLPEDLLEKDKYRLMWATDNYREWSPGNELVDDFLERVSPDSLIIDFGCGTGRAIVSMAEKGHDVIGVDFADNCRDRAAYHLPFLEWDLTLPCPLSANYGFCTDVLEHIKPEEVDQTIRNIMSSAKTVYFQISTKEAIFGRPMGIELHLTVQNAEWWRDKFHALGFPVLWSEKEDQAVRLIVTRDDA